MWVRGVLRASIAVVSLWIMMTLLSGCSAGKQGLLSITPQQYFYSAKEKLETIDERNYVVRDLDEIIRVLENAEKDAKSGEIIDKSRLYLLLATTLKASKEFMENRLKGTYIANRAEPFYVLDVKPVRETLRIAKKWLRSLESTFKTKSVAPDLQFVKGMYYTQKMLTQSGVDRRESLWVAVEAYRRCLGLAPDYKSDFRLFGRILTPRDVRLKLIECLALGGEVADAYALASEYTFTPSNPRLDYPWMHGKGLVLAMMGFQLDAKELLEKFKIVLPIDYPKVDEALWVLEGVFDRLKEESPVKSIASASQSLATLNDTPALRWGMEAKIVAAILKKLKGPFSKEKYTTASHVFPYWLAGDKTYFEGVKAFVDGQFAETLRILAPIRYDGMVSASNRLAGRVLMAEAELYAGKKIGDEVLFDLLKMSLDKQLSPLMRERIGFLLARCVLGEDKDFKQGRLEGEGQTFIKSITSKAWALKVNYEKGSFRRAQPVNAVSGIASETVGEAAGLNAEIYANRPEDWLVSANLSLIALPEMNLLGKGRIVGREEEGKGWVFKSPEISEMKHGNRYLVVFEFANSDNDKNIQGVLLDP